MKSLETERLLLRKFIMDDLPAVQSYAGCAENIIYMMWGPNSEDQTRAFINSAISKAEEVPCTNYQFAAILKETEKLIGGCDLSVSGDEAEIGWILHRDYWKQGFGTEMGNEMLRLGFEEIKLHRIVAHCDAENYGSFRVMEKIGMRREGFFLEARPGNKTSKKKYSDEFSYAITKDAWEISKENLYYNSLPCEFNGFLDLPDLFEWDIE